MKIKFWNKIQTNKTFVIPVSDPNPNPNTLPTDEQNIGKLCLNTLLYGFMSLFDRTIA